MNKPSYIYHLLLLFIFFINTEIVAQQSFTINLNNSSGLPSSTVYDFIQDSKGFIWIASNAGLTRYDGFEFITYHSKDQTSLAGSNVQEDTYGRIWYQNFDGHLYYVEDDVLHNLDQHEPGEFVPFGIVKEYLFLIQQDGVDVYHLKDLKLVRTLPLSNENIISSTVLDGKFYFLADNVVYRLDQNLKISSSNYFKDNHIKVNRLNNDGSKLTFLYKNSGIHTMYFMDQKLNYTGLQVFKSEGVIMNEQYFHGHHWIFTSNGFYCYTPSGAVILRNDKLDLDEKVNKVLIDKNGSLWFSSISNGLYLISDLKNKKYDFPDFEFRDIVAANNGFYLSTSSGELVELTADFKLSDQLNLSTDKQSIINFHFDKEANLLLYTTTSGFYILHHKKQVYFQDIAVKKVMKLDRRYYAVAASGYVMLLKNPVFNDRSYLSKWDEIYERQADSKFPNMSILKSNLRAKYLSYYADESEFVVSSNLGLWVFSTRGIVEQKIDEKRFYSNELFSYNKKLFLLDYNGNFHVMYRSGKSQCLNSELGIPTSAVKFIKRFGNTLYLICANRVYEYDMTYSSSQVYSYNTNMLVVSDLLVVGNKILLVSKSKLVTIGIDRKVIQKKIPDFHFTNFYAGSKRVKREDLMHLSHDQNMIRFSFSILDYATNVEPRMSYRINQGEWVKVQAGSREVQLLSLSPGRYQLDFKINHTILKSPVYFVISKPFYLRPWFITGVVVLVLVASLLLHLRRVKTMNHKIKLLNEKVFLENQLRKSMLTSIKAQMNPHFFYNALNTIQSYIFSNDKFHATTYLAKFSKLTRMILEMSGQNSVKLVDELKSLELYLELEQMRFQTDFYFEIHCDSSINVNRTKIPSMLIQPYVENAVKHGLLHRSGEKRLRIKLKLFPEYLEVIIEDNGVGRARSREINQQKLEKPRSFSTKSTKLRLDLINHDSDVVSVWYEDLFDDQKVAKGTRVKLNISIKSYVN